MALKIVSGLDVTSISLSSFLDLAKNELRNAQIHNLSTTQINAISSPVQGQLVYDTTLDLLKVYDGAAWQLVGAEPDDSTIELSSNTLSIKDGGVSTAKIANDAVTAAKLADTAVTAGSYTAADITIDAQGRITSASSGTIATSEIADDAVTAAKLANTAVTAGSYTAADITIDAQGRITAAASGTIATAEIADDAVTNAKLADNSVDSDQYVDGSIDEVHIGDGAVTASKIADNNVGATQLNVVGNGSSGQVLASDGDGTFSWQNAGSDVDVSVANLIARLDDISANFQIGNGAAVEATFSGDVVVTGDLSVNGTTTTIQSTTVTIDDPIFTLGGETAPTADDNKDRGIEFRYFQSSAKVGFFGMDETDNTFKFIPDATNTSEVFSGEVGDAEFNTLKAANITFNGTAISSTAAELNILDGVTATTAEINKLDGVTATTAELNILDGVTATASELNLLDGVTATTTELNYIDGVTSAIQTQLDAKPKAYSADVTTSSGTATIAHTAHGLSFPANVQVYDENGQLVLADVRQTVSGGNMTITLNAPDATYSVIAIGASA